MQPKDYFTNQLKTATKVVIKYVFASTQHFAYLQNSFQGAPELLNKKCTSWGRLMVKLDNFNREISLLVCDL